MTEPASRVSGPGRIQSVTRLLAVAVLTGALGLGAGGVGAVVGGAGAAPAEATPTHVALIVSSAAGQVGTACVGWRSGMSGLDVLGAGANYQTGTGRYTGFVLYINGVGTSRPSNSTFWEYYRGNGNGALSPSGLGAASTNPAAGSVEAWAYQPGSANVPPGLTYASICHDTAAPPPSRAPTTSRRSSGSRRIAPPPASPSTPGPVPATSNHGSRAAVPPDSSPPGGSRRPTSAADASSGVPTGSVTRARPTTTAASASSTFPRSATSGALTSLVPAAATNDSSGGGSPAGVIVGGVALALLGGVAVWRRHVGLRS